MEVHFNQDTTFENHVTFAEDEISIVKTALKTKLYRRDEPTEVRVGKFQVMLTALSEKFGIPEVRFQKVDGNWVGANFDPETNRIEASRYSLVSIMMAFGDALRFHKNQQLAEGAEPFRLNPLGFGLCAFKQAAPIMYQTAKDAGRLVIPGGAPYTGDGDLGLPDLGDSSSDDVDEQHDDVPPMRPDIDPENRDRGNGRGED